MPYSSPFEAAVGNFLQSYAGMRGLRMQEGEAADRRRQSKRADQLSQIQMNEAGYDEVQMPEIQAPPGQNFAQKVGRFLSGPEQPSSIVMKTHASTRDNEIAEAQQFDLRRDQSHFDNDRAVTELQGALQARMAANRQAHEDARNRADNATRLAVAGMERGSIAATRDASLRDHFFDQAVEAAGGDAVQAMTNAERFQKGAAVKFGATRTDYHAAAARYRDRKAALTREGIQSREDIANKKGSAKEQFRQALLKENQPASSASDPVASMSDADAWEYYVSHGATSAQATAKVNARKK